MPRVSVIIPAYNAAAYLPYAIESVIGQTYTDWEIVLVDDGSTDATGELAASYQHKLQDKFQYVRQNNRGVPAARNAGIRAARGDLIALLDADDVWLPQRLERGVKIMDAQPDTGFVHARVMRIDSQGKVTGQLRVATKYMSGQIARHIYARRAHVICPTVLFRRSCLETAGWFDENMYATEDRDLWFRIASRFRVAFIDDVLANYRLSPFSVTSNLQRMLECQTFFIEKHFATGAASHAARLEALGNIYRELGDALFKRGDLSEATQSYLKAVRYYPLSVPNVYMLFRALMDPIVRVCVPAKAI